MDTRIEEPVIYGEPYKQGERNDIREFIDSIKEGKSDLELLNLYPDQYVRFPHLPEKIRMVIPPNVSTKIVELKPWQNGLDQYVQTEPDPRKIKVFIDIKGGQGKTEMTRYLIKKYDAFLAQGKSPDILYAYQFKKSKIVIFDIPRSTEHLSWHSVECIKNGLYMNTKYHSCMVVFDVPHVILFINFMPDKRKLSEDRWDIIYLNEDEDPEWIEKESKRRRLEYLESKFE